MSGDDAGDAHDRQADAMLGHGALMDVLRAQREDKDKHRWKAAKKAKEYVEAGRREAATDTSGC